MFIVGNICFYTFVESNRIMQYKFITNLILLLLLNLLIKPFWIFGIDRTVQNIVGPETYGNYYALLNFSFLFSILLDVGINNFNNRNIAQHTHLLSKHFGKILSVKFLLGVVFFLFSIAFGWIVGYSEAQLKLLLLLLLNQFLISLTFYFRSNIAGLQLFRIDSVISVLDKAIMAIICAVLIWGNALDKPISIEWFVYAQTIGYVVSALVSWYFVYRKTFVFKLSFSKIFTYSILRQSLPYALLILLMMFYSKIDGVMLERMLEDGDYQAGIYAQGYRIVDAFNMFAFLFAGLLFPMFSRMLSVSENVNPLCVLSFRVLAIPALLIAGLSVLYAEEIMLLLYHDTTQASFWCFAILAISFVPVSISYIYGTLLTAGGFLKEMNRIATVGLLLNVILNTITIPKFGLLGAAGVTLITQSLVAISQMLLCRNKFLIFPGVKLLGHCFGMLVLLVIAYFSKSMFFDNWLIELTVVCAVLITYVISFKVINFGDLYTILKEKR